MPPPADLRVLEGANRWFPGPAVQLTLDALFDDPRAASLFATTFMVVDLETTGGAPSGGGITEIGAVKVRGGEVLGEFPVGEAAAVAERAALPGRAAPGPPGSDRRLRFATRLAAHLARRAAAAAGTTRLPVRGRSGPGAQEVMVAWPWPRRSRLRRPRSTPT